MGRATGQRHRRMDGIADLRPGDHLCWAYPDQDSFEQVLVPYVQDGLARGQRVACFLPAAVLDQIRGRLEAIPGIAEAVARDALQFGSSEAAYLPGGVFDPDLRLAAYEAMVELAIAEGFEALRVVGEATTVVNDPVAREGWPGYELRADLMAARLPFIAMCAYHLRSCDPGVLALLHGVHAGAFGTADLEVPFHLFGDASGVLSLDGEVDFCSSEAIERITKDAARDVKAPVVDLSALRFIDASGMRGLVNGMRAIAGDGARVRLLGAGPAFRRMWELLAYDRQIEAEFEAV